MILSKEREYRFEPSPSLWKTIVLREFIRRNATYQVDEELLQQLTVVDLEESGYHIISDAGMDLRESNYGFDTFEFDTYNDILSCNSDDPFNLSEFHLDPIEPMDLLTTIAPTSEFNVVTVTWLPYSGKFGRTLGHKKLDSVFASLISMGNRMILTTATGNAAKKLDSEFASIIAMESRMILPTSTCNAAMKLDSAFASLIAMGNRMILTTATGNAEKNLLRIHQRLTSRTLSTVWVGLNKEKSLKFLRNDGEPRCVKQTADVSESAFMPSFSVDYVLAYDVQQRPVLGAHNSNEIPNSDATELSDKIKFDNSSVNKKEFAGSVLPLSPKAAEKPSNQPAPSVDQKAADTAVSTDEHDPTNKAPTGRLRRFAKWVRKKLLCGASQQ